MKRITVAIALVLGGTSTVYGWAQSLDSAPIQKPGLWEMKPIKSVIDGRDMNAQMSAAQEKMKQAMANMSPDQRAKIESMTGGMSNGSGNMKICISPAMAAKKQPIIDKEGKCPPAKFRTTGNVTTFEINCTQNGRTTVGSGTSTINGDSVMTSTNMTVSDARGQHTMQNETQMTFLGADCQGITPADQLMESLKGVQH